MSLPINVSTEESILLQSLATNSLLGELLNRNYVKTQEYKQLNMDPLCDYVLQSVGLGNHALMQMMLYGLLVIPREVLSKNAYAALEVYAQQINPVVRTLVEKETCSTYKGEVDLDHINYFHRIRNAIAHARCTLVEENGKNFVIFSDRTQDGSAQCMIKMECYKVAAILNTLIALIYQYFCSNHQDEF